MQRLFIICLLFFSCQKTETTQAIRPEDYKPEVKDDGQTIVFKKYNTRFSSIVINKNSLMGNYIAPASIVASILKPSRAEASNIILFDKEELNLLYTSYLSLTTHYKKDSDYLLRVQDMYAHQAATGMELRDAETGVADAATELAEKEGRFRMLGFDPSELNRAKPGIVWLMSDVSESVLNSLGKGQNCSIEFTSFPGQEFTGKIDALGEVLDPATRTLKVRIIMSNKEGKFRSGMFARVRFNLNVKDALAVPATSVISVQGKNYIFKKDGNTIHRVAVVTESQIGDQMIVFKGLTVGDSVITEGAMLLKGLSFGY